MKILITGGHHNSAFPVMTELKKLDEKITFIWVGHRISMLGDVNDSAEFKEVATLKVPFFDIQAGKFYGIYNPFRLLKIIFGFVNAFKLLLKERPDGILSFGGYIAVPVVFCAWILGIPAVTHEQTAIAGYANKVISRFAKKILISWPSSAAHYPKEKVVFTGLPLREEIFTSTTNRFAVDISKPVIYITGGKQGAHSLNECVKEILSDLLRVTNVIHSCGSSSVYDDFKTLCQIKDSLPEELKSSYFPVDYIPSHEIGEVFKKSSLIVGRSGAHTIYELLALKKPAVLIPLDWVSHNEQEENARILEKMGLAVVIMQKELTPKLLLEKITYVLNNLSKFEIKDTNFNLKLSAASEIAYEVYRTFIKN